MAQISFSSCEQKKARSCRVPLPRAGMASLFYTRVVTPLERRKKEWGLTEKFPDAGHVGPPWKHVAQLALKAPTGGGSKR
jgi:hypothetical protein